MTMKTIQWPCGVGLACVLISSAYAGCIDPGTDCSRNRNACPPFTGSLTNGGGGTGANDGTGAGDTGAGGPGGGPSGCMTDAQCTEPMAARCNTATGECEQCTESPQCAAGVEGLGVCDSGTCVACNVSDESGCSASQTCDLDSGSATFRTCVDVAENTLSVCDACTNDRQCGTDSLCLPMDLDMTPNGFFCLAASRPPTVPPTPRCDQPYQV
ncbi:MAG: hypothetical protein AAGA56_15380, partial [Myxococcota bacterium]